MASGRKRGNEVGTDKKRPAFPLDSARGPAAGWPFRGLVPERSRRAAPAITLPAGG